MSSTKSLRERQKGALISMISSGYESKSDLPQWKVLIYDKSGADIILPLLKVADLHQHFVTLNKYLFSKRDPVDGVLAVYFMEATEQNIRQLGSDMKKQMYSHYSINFIYRISRPLLEMLGTEVKYANAIDCTLKVCDQYLDFVSIGDNIFTSNATHSYKCLHSLSQTQSTQEILIGRCVDSLFSALLVAGHMPIIRCNRGGIADSIAQRLEGKLKDHLLNTRSDKQDSSSSIARRPLLVLLDRDVDLGIMLQHTWSYQALIHDLLELDKSQVSFTPSSFKADSKADAMKKTFDVDQDDYFWNKFGVFSFPEICEQVNIELNAYKAESEKLTKAASTQSEDDAVNQLKKTVTALPELQKKKELIDIHTSVVMTLLDIIKKRNIDLFYKLEDNSTKENKQAIIDMIKDVNKGTADDKIRLACCYVLARDDLAPTDVEDIEKALKANNYSLKAFSFVKNLKSTVKMSTAGKNIFSRFSSLHQKLTENIKEGKLMDGAVDILKSGISNILPSHKDTIATRLVDALMEGKSSAETDDFSIYDPKGSLGPKGSMATLPLKQVYHEAVVMMIGGGNFVEYQNLQEYAQRQKKNILYGCTDLVTPTSFLEQLNELDVNRKN